MIIAAGKILMSSASMEDDNFQGSMIFIVEYNEKGAMAFVINQMAERPLNALVEFNNSLPFPLFNGGPVDKEHLFFVHRQNNLITGGTHIIDDIYLGGDFNQTIKCINNKMLTEADIKIFIGYCGWDAGELEDEIAEGSWVNINCHHEIIFANAAFIPKAKANLN